VVASNPDHLARYPLADLFLDSMPYGARTTAADWLGARFPPIERERAMIRKLKSGQYRLYSRKLDPKTRKRRNLGTFKSRAAAEKHEKAVQYFKLRG
jgi:hypothetical protein